MPSKSTSGKHKAPCLAFFGTGSEVGKSVLTTAMCRFLVNRGISTAPFKSQNMSNNSGVTPEGLEMGRAQIVQAEAAKIPPHVDMNPILLKPTTDVGAQVVFMGKAEQNLTASQYHVKKGRYFNEVCAALNRLRSRFDAVIMEGAGSCAEVNLMAHDLVNFKMAEAAEAPVVLVADIHRGGVFAQIVGTLECLEPRLRDKVAGFIINRFRGDLSLFDEGVDWLEKRTGKKCFGVLPWYSHFRIESEDSVTLEQPATRFSGKPEQPAVAVLRLPHIANFTDFQPLEDLEGLFVYYLESPVDLDGFSGLVIPGSKNTRFDLQWLHDTGWSARIRSFADRQGHVLGICGGYQMMGKTVKDPSGLEGKPGDTPGLDLLPLETVLKAPKTTTLTRFSWDGIVGEGYEIHMGQTTLSGGGPLLDLMARNEKPVEETDGCKIHNGRICGAYIHGMFDRPEITAKWLSIMGVTGVRGLDKPGGMAAKNRDYDLLARHFEKHMDTKGLMGLLGL